MYSLGRIPRAHRLVLSVSGLDYVRTFSAEYPGLLHNGWFSLPPTVQSTVVRICR